MKKLKIATMLVISTCFFSNVAINAMENREKKDTGIVLKKEFVKPEEYSKFFDRRFGIRKEDYCEADVNTHLTRIEVQYPIKSFSRRLVLRKDSMDKYLYEYFDYLISVLDNDVYNYKGYMKNHSINTLYMNIRKFSDDLKERYKIFTDIYKGDEKYYDYIMKNYIDEILSIKNHFTVKKLSEDEEDEIVMEGLEDRILKEKLEKIYKKLKSKLIRANIEVEQGLENSYEHLMDIINESIKFDEDLIEGYKPKTENNIRETFENLFETRRAIADFIEVVNFEISLLQQMRVINPEVIDGEDALKLNDRSDFINFIP